MVTPRDIITLALDDAGIAGEGQTPSARWMNNGFTRLNWLLSQWNVKRGLIFRETTTGVTSTGAVSYTIGPSGQFDVPIRPDKLTGAFIRQLVPAAPNQVDYPLTLILSREDYNALPMKQIGTLPYYLWYDPTYPLGTLYPWPVPQASLYALHVSTKAVIEQFGDLSDDVELPSEYYNALRWNLTVELRSAADLPPQPIAVQLAKVALNTLRGANVAVPLLRMPPGLTRGGGYNVFSDRGG